CARLDYMDYW
nr:immunoglobulin heavy chain junction region [Mus musculus]